MATFTTVLLRPSGYRGQYRHWRPCPRCRREVFWCVTTNDRAIAFDGRPHVVRTLEDGIEVVSTVHVPVHFGTCAKRQTSGQAAG